MPKVCTGAAARTAAPAEATSPPAEASSPPAEGAGAASLLPDIGTLLPSRGASGRKLRRRCRRLPPWGHPAQIRFRAAADPALLLACAAAVGSKRLLTPGCALSKPWFTPQDAMAHKPHMGALMLSCCAGYMQFERVQRLHAASSTLCKQGNSRIEQACRQVGSAVHRAAATGALRMGRGV